MARQIKLFFTLCEEKKWEEARRRIHTIKGACANVGATAMNETAKRVEQAVEAILGQEEGEDPMDIRQLLLDQFELFKVVAEPEND